MNSPSHLAPGAVNGYELADLHALIAPKIRFTSSNLVSEGGRTGLEARSLVGHLIALQRLAGAQSSLHQLVRLTRWIQARRCRPLRLSGVNGNQCALFLGRSIPRHLTLPWTSEGPIARLENLVKLGYFSNRLW